MFAGFELLMVIDVPLGKLCTLCLEQMAPRMSLVVVCTSVV